MHNSITLLGHVLGFISVALFFYSYQRTQKSKIMLIQTAATALSCVQYLLIGATSGFALNIVCIIRNFAFYYREKNNYSYQALSDKLMLHGIDIHKQEIYKIETGKRTVVDYELCGFAKCFNISLDTLVSDYMKDL